MVFVQSSEEEEEERENRSDDHHAAQGEARGTGVSELPVRVAPLAGLPFCRSV